jgi:hypothetical protein
MMVTDAWGTPVYLSKLDDKWYLVDGRNQDIRVQIPAGAKPKTGSDHHMVIVAPDGTETDFWLASYDPIADKWTAGWVGQTSIKGWGAMCLPGQRCSGANAAGFAQHGGSVVPEEIKQGHIDHALFITTPYTRADFIACPAVHEDGKYNDPLAIPEGARVQLDPAFNVDAQPWQPWQKVVAKALQRYGAYIGDTGGSLAVKAEAANLDQRDGTWASVSVPVPAGLQFIPWAKLRVLKFVPC